MKETSAHIIGGGVMKYFLILVVLLTVGCELTLPTTIMPITVTDLITGRPLEGITVQIVTEQGIVQAEGLTNPSGMVTLAYPQSSKAVFAYAMDLDGSMNGSYFPTIHLITEYAVRVDIELSEGEVYDGL